MAGRGWAWELGRTLRLRFLSKVHGLVSQLWKSGGCSALGQTSPRKIWFMLATPTGQLFDAQPCFLSNFMKKTTEEPYLMNIKT